MNMDSVSDTGPVMFSILTSECRQIQCCLKMHKIGIRDKKKTYKMTLSSPFDTPICPIHQPRNVEYNEVFFLCTLEMF